MGCCHSTTALTGQDPDDVSTPIAERSSLLGVSRQTGRSSSNTAGLPQGQRSERTDLQGLPSYSAASSGSCPSFSHFMLQYRDLRPEDFDLLCKLDDGIPGRGTSPQDVVDKLPRMKASDCCSADACRVCLGKFESDTSVIQLPCQHAFHAECISRWLTQYKSTCPLCSTAIKCEGDKEASAEKNEMQSNVLSLESAQPSAKKSPSTCSTETGALSGRSSMFANDRDEISLT
mmetsp:Transcript_6073/g.9440  ORF Transcript_6073/g.9440 Transcript_6073/m.9440 type:complete len:232 (-) Transcript_6073:98-793(-)